MRNEVLLRVKEKRNILQTVNRRKGNWIGQVLCRNCLLKHVIAGKVERRINVTERRGRRRMELLYDFEENRGHWKLKYEVLGRTVWRSGFGRGCGTVLRQAAVWRTCALFCAGMGSLAFVTAGTRPTAVTKEYSSFFFFKFFIPKCYEIQINTIR